MKHPGAFSTTTGCLVALLVTPHLSTAYGPTPGLQWDPETISPCVMWHDNAGDSTCTEVRDYWDISPALFSRWNPSVGLDCTPWGNQSYCVVPEERLIMDPRPSVFPPTSTVASFSSSATSTSIPAPTSTAWEALGCYVDEDEAQPVLERRISSQGGGAALTIAKCQVSCYRESLMYAGVKAGDECWCGSSVGGELAGDETECNLPCSGDGDEVCGGEDRLDVFVAALLEDENEGSDEGNDENGDDSNDDGNDDGDEDGEGSSTSGEALEEESSTSGASRYRPLFLF